jgi:hypothetical protein
MHYPQILHCLLRSDDVSGQRIVHCILLSVDECLCGKLLKLALLN